MTRILITLIAVAVFFSSPVSAETYDILQEESKLSFTGEHAGNAFTGRFKDYAADIVFDPENLEASNAVVSIQTASAVTGNKMYDGTLPNKDWFDVKSYPSAEFRSTAFMKADEGLYKVSGDLMIKGKTVPVSFDFTFSEDGEQAVVQSAFELDRLALGLGVESDPNAEWVSKMIDMTIYLVAKPVDAE